MMSKYAPLSAHLSLSAAPHVSMTFSEIESLVGPLPRSARDHRAWWSNDTGSHVQARAWIAAGYVLEGVDQLVGRATFARSETAQ